MNTTFYPLLKPISQLLRPWYGGVGHILMLHRVLPEEEQRRVPGGASALGITPTLLEAIIAFFRERGYDFLSLDQMVARLDSQDFERPFVVFTFDDGWADNATIAYPILNRRQVPFAIYVATDYPDGKAVLWWYLMDDLISQSKPVQFQVDGHAYSFDCSKPEEQAQAALTIRHIFKSATHKNYLPRAQAVFEANGLDIFAHTRNLSLSWEQIKTLDANPLVTIGAHTCSHPALNALPEKEARGEINQGKAILEEKLGHPVNHFAYPFGGRFETGLKEFDLARLAGFTTAVTTRMSNIQPEHVDYPFSLPRLDIPRLANIESLELAVNGLIPARLNHLHRVVTL